MRSINIFDYSFVPSLTTFSMLTMLLMLTCRPCLLRTQVRSLSGSQYLPKNYNSRDLRGHNMPDNVLKTKIGTTVK